MLDVYSEINNTIVHGIYARIVLYFHSLITIFIIFWVSYLIIQRSYYYIVISRGKFCTLQPMYWGPLCGIEICGFYSTAIDTYTYYVIYSLKNKSNKTNDDAA